MADENKILFKRSQISGNIPRLTSIDLGELALNTTDGKIFIKKNDSIVEFLNSNEFPYNLNKNLSSISTQFGNNSANQVFSSVLGGFNNNITGAGSSIINGESNEITSDFALIGSGFNNKIHPTGDYSVILGGQNNHITHKNSFTLGSNLSSHAENFTYVNNLSSKETVQASTFKANQGLPLSSDFSNVGYTFETDGDTGMFSPIIGGQAGNGTLAFLCNSTETMRMNYNGKVGIGTTNPNEKLTVSGSISATGIISASASNIRVNVVNTTTSRTFSDSDSNKIFHFNTSLSSVSASFPTSLSNGFNAVIMNTGTNSLIISAANLNSAGTTITTRFGGAFVYKDSDNVFAVGRLT